MQWKEPLLHIVSEETRGWIIVVNVIIPSMMAVFCAVASMIAGSAIQGSLAIDGALIQWVSTAYLLGINSIVPIANKLADRFGYKKCYFWGVCLFTLGTLFSSFAFDFWSLSLARFIEGVGAGFIFPVGMALIIQNISPKNLKVALNLYLGLGLGAGLGLGTLYSGYFSMEYTWRLIFFWQFPVGIISLILLVLFHKETEKNPLKKWDLLGYFSFIFFIAFLVIALSEGALPSTAGGWRDPFIIFCFGFSFISFLITFYREKVSKNPTISFFLMYDFSFLLGCLSLFVLGATFFVTLSSLAPLMENILGYDRFHTGLICMTYGLTMGIFSILVNIVSQKVSGFFLGIFGLSLIVISFFLNYSISWLSGSHTILFILFLRGLGMAFSLGPITAFSLKNISSQYSSEAATLLTFFRQLGGTYGGVIFGIITTKRAIFHSARFAEATNPFLPGYQKTLTKLQEYIFDKGASFSGEVTQLAKAKIIEQIKIESYLQAVADGYWIFGFVSLTITLLLLLLSLWNTFRKKEISLQNK